MSKECSERLLALTQRENESLAIALDLQCRRVTDIRQLLQDIYEDAENCLTPEHIERIKSVLDLQTVDKKLCPTCLTLGHKYWCPVLHGV